MPKRTIVITGPSDGIGAAAARRLAAAGDNVVVVGRSASNTTAIAEELAADYLCADVGNAIVGIKYRCRNRREIQSGPASTASIVRYRAAMRLSHLATTRGRGVVVAPHAPDRDRDRRGPGRLVILLGEDGRTPSAKIRAPSSI
ncbi:SDR family NAD(P)-dependent oxidoreductase [Mycobacterium nebraskense]|nr:SDR family NAD(P)-dependent oxidoreductase [Mycobacterium nebraskense]